MSMVATDTLGWPFHLLWLRCMMAVAVSVHQDLGGGCAHNLGKEKNFVSVIFFIDDCITTEQFLILSRIMYLNFVQIVFGSF